MSSDFDLETRFGRPRTLGMIRSTTISLYEKYREVYPLAVELANVERISFSELVSRALKEYVEAHHPGNPQLTLKEAMREIPLALKLQARNHVLELERLMRAYDSAVGRHAPKGYIQNLERALREECLKAAKVKRRIKDMMLETVLEKALGKAYPT